MIVQSFIGLAVIVPEIILDPDLLHGKKAGLNRVNSCKMFLKKVIFV